MVTCGILLMVSRFDYDSPASTVLLRGRSHVIKSRPRDLYRMSRLKNIIHICNNNCETKLPDVIPYDCLPNSLFDMNNPGINLEDSKE